MLAFTLLQGFMQEEGAIICIIIRCAALLQVVFLIVMCSDHLLCSYIIAGLNMIREMIKRWWMQLKTATNKGIEPEWQRCSRCVHVQSYVMSIQLMGLVLEYEYKQSPQISVCLSCIPISQYIQDSIESKVNELESY